VPSRRGIFTGGEHGGSGATTTRTRRATFNGTDEVIAEHFDQHRPPPRTAPRSSAATLAKVAGFDSSKKLAVERHPAARHRGQLTPDSAHRSEDLAVDLGEWVTGQGDLRRRRHQPCAPDSIGPGRVPLGGTSTVSTERGRSYRPGYDAASFGVRDAVAQVGHGPPWAEHLAARPYSWPISPEVPGDTSVPWSMPTQPST